MSKSIKSNKEFTVDIIYYNKTGNKYLINIKADPLYDKQENFIGFLSMQNDITEKQDYVNQIFKLNLINKEQFKKLGEVNKSLEDFAYITTHDLKASIRNTRSLLEVIQKKGDQLDKEKNQEYVKIILTAANEMNMIIDQHLEYSRTGVSSEKEVMVNRPDFFQDVFKTFQKDLKNIPYVLTYDLEVKGFSVNPILFKRLINNLIFQPK